MPEDRLARLPRRDLSGGIRLFEARARRARLLGLAWLDELPPNHALLIPRCRSVHTFGMRFALDLVFLDHDQRPTTILRNVPPRRIASDRRAHSVIEVSAGQADRLLAALEAAEAAQPPAPTRRRSRNVSADSASSSVTFSSSD